MQINNSKLRINRKISDTNHKQRYIKIRIDCVTIRRQLSS